MPGLEEVADQATDGAIEGTQENDRASDYLAQMQRLKADFENFRRRMMQEQVHWGERAVASLLRELIPVVDNLERACFASPSQEEGEGSSPGSLRQGLELTLRQFQGVLANAGVQPISSVGEPFDPRQHEAMGRVESREYPVDTVVEEYQKGYIYKGQVLRPALVKVVVALAPAGEPTQAHEEDN